MASSCTSARLSLRQALEVELLERLGGAERGAAQPQVELLLLAPGDLVLDQQGEELGVGELAVDGLAVARLQRVEDAGQAQLLELRGRVRECGFMVVLLW